jgi:FOG: LysM repeat
MNRTAYMMMEGQNYYQINKKRVWIVGVALLLILVVLSVGFITKTVTAQDSHERVKLVTSVEVKKGDTLWSIASNYYSSDYVDMNEYIKEIKMTNGLSDDNIHAGNYIVVPYYEDTTY